MGFMDKVKAQATVLAEKAQEGAKAGQEKIGQLQSKRQSDAILLELGGIFYLEHEGRATPNAESRVTDLVSRLRAFETEHGQITVTSADAQPGETGTFVPTAGTAATVSNPVPSASPPPPPPAASPEAPSTIPGGGMPASAPSAGGIPQSSTGIPTASYSSDDAGDQG